MPTHVADYRDLDPTSLGNSWKQANPKRGLKDHVHAVTFLQEFPIGTTLSVAQFDEWLERHGLLSVPQNVSKNSVQWKAHLHDRHNWKMRLNRGASHPRLNDQGLQAFSIDSVGQGIFEVRTTHDSVVHAELPRKVQSVLETKRKRLQYLMQSVDWTLIPGDDRLRTETIYDNIEGLRNLIGFQVAQIDRNIQMLERRIRLAIETGTLKPKNGGIRQLLAPEEDNGASEIETAS